MASGSADKGPVEQGPIIIGGAIEETPLRRMTWCSLFTILMAGFLSVAVVMNTDPVTQVEDFTAAPPFMEKDPDMAARRVAEAYDNPCPFLKTAYVQGLVKASPIGYTTENSIQALMDWAGVGRMAFPSKPYLVKYGTSGLPLLHLALNRPTDTGAMHKDASPEEKRARLDKFLSFADKDGYFGPVEFERAIEHQNKEKGGDQTFLVAQRGELATMLTVFGHARGSEYRSLWPLANVLHKDDIEALWWRNEWPKGWLNRRRREWSGFTDVDVVMGIRFMLMAREQARSGYVPVEVMETAFMPYPGNFLGDPGFPNPIAPSATEAAPTHEEIAALVPGGNLSTYDSRMGGPQPNPSYPDKLFFPEPFPEEYWQPAWREYEARQGSGNIAFYVFGGVILLALGLLLCPCSPWACYGRERKQGYTQRLP